MLLDFEKPLYSLEQELAEMRSRAEKGEQNLTGAINKLSLELEKLKKEVFSQLTPWQRVQLSRHEDRPYTLDYISHMTDAFFEMHGDRKYADDQAMVGGMAKIGDKNVIIIGQQKGRTTKERQKRRFGMPNPEGYRKALRLMKLAEKFNNPIVTLIDTPGAYPGLEAEERGQAEAIAKNIQSMVSLKVPVLCIIIGEGASGGALGIGVGDRVLMFENTWYSVIAPESCSSILWKNRDYKEKAAESLQLTAKDMHAQKLIDEILPEPLGGAHRDPQATASTLKKAILTHLTSLEKHNPEKRIALRVEKYATMGLSTINK